MDKECPICYEVHDDTSIKLKCGHIFHYNCISSSYKSSISKNNRNIRICPYCRNDGGFLKLLETTYPVKGINYEFYEIEKYLLRNDFNKLQEITKKYIDKTKCNAILKSGINKGYQCKKNKKKELHYCHLHHNDELNK